MLEHILLILLIQMFRHSTSQFLGMVAKFYALHLLACRIGQRDENQQITVVFGLKGMQVAPAGVGTPNSGHHHLLINLDQLPNLNAPLPASDQVLHFGKGQTSTSLKLPPGKHRLQLILGNQVHIPHDPPVISEVIEIEVR